MNDLSQVFKTDYGFHVEKKKINNTENSQWDLIAHLSAFFRNHDSEQTLLIIYYAGHGWAPPSLHRDFNIHGLVFASSPVASNLLTRKRKSNAAKSEMNCVKWHEAENMLSYVKADIFAIFDCCNAGRLCHTRGPALWEVLGACSEDQTTEPPSPESFTRALIWALQQLRLKEKCRFSTSELRRKIKEAPDLPEHQQPPLKNRTNDSLPHIYIAPYSKEENASALTTSFSSEDDQVDVAQYFDIRLHATVVTNALIERTAEILNELIAPDSNPHLAIDRISFLGSGSFNRVYQIALSWLEKTRVKKNMPTSDHSQKTKALNHPSNSMPDSTIVQAYLGAPLHLATSEISVSSNTTTFAEGRHETIFAGPVSVDEPSDNGTSIGDKTATVTATAMGERSPSDRDRETEDMNLQTPARQEQVILAGKKKSSSFRRGSSISGFLRSRILRLKSQTSR